MVAREDIGPGPLGARPRQRHGWVAASAALVSLLAHAALIHFAPPMPVGRLATIDEDGRIQSLVLRDVQVDVPRTVEQPARFEARDASTFMPEMLAPESFQALVEEFLPPPTADVGQPLAGEDRALAELAAVAERPLWDARQDLVHIRDRIVPDDVATFARRMIPDVERVPDAPDLAVPGDALAGAQRERGAQWLQGQAWAANGAGPGRAFGVGQRAIDPALEDAPETTVERVDAVTEEDEEITAIAPIEQLLALEVQTFSDPADPGYEYFQIRIFSIDHEGLPVLPRDVLLIQDASGSMTQRTIYQARHGWHAWLDSLSADDRVDLIAFRDHVERAFGELRPFNPRSQARAATFIEGLRARGGTDVFGSLEPLLAMEVNPARPTLAVLVSDGIPTTGVVDSTTILESFTAANAGAVSVFTIGGGPQVNEYLLDFLSFKNRGDTIMTFAREEIPDSMAQLARELSRPVLTFLRMQWAGDIDRFQVYPESLTHLYLDRPLVVYGRKPVDVRQAFVQIVGRSGADMKDMFFRIDFDEAGAGAPAIRTLWAWQRLYYLIGQHIRTQDPDLMDEIQRVTRQFGLNVAYGRDAVPMHFERRFHFHGQRGE